MNFFDKYKNFTNSGNKHSLERLNYRYNQIIDSNLDLIINKKILDIACHDGRWSFPALVNGASHVTGVEPKEKLIDEFKENLKGYESKYTIIQEDIHKQIGKFQDNEFDCVMCLGFLYHSPYILYLISQMSRIARESIIIDSRVNGSKDLVENYKLEFSQSRIGSAFSEKECSFVSLPSKNLVIKFLNYYNFETNVIKNPTQILEYKNELRVTIRAIKNKNKKLKFIEDV